MRKVLALSFVQRVLMLAVYVAATMILARLLTPEQVGIFSMTAAFVGIGSVFREFGMSEFLVQARDVDRQMVRAVYGVAVVMGWSVGLVVLLLSPLVASAYGQSEVRSIAFVLCLNFLLLPFATPSMAMLAREMKLAQAWAIQSVAVIVQYAVSIVLAWKGAGPISLAWGSVASSVCCVVLLTIVRPTELRLLPSLKGSRPAWRYGLKFASASSLEVAAKNVHEFVIPRAFGFAALGLYSRAAGLIEQFNQNFRGAISRVLIPTFAQDARAGSVDLASRYGQATAYFTCFAWPFFAVIAVTAPEVILTLFGDQWTAATPLLRLMCLAGLIQSAYPFAGDVLASTGQIGSRLRIVSVTGPLWVVLCLGGSLIGLEAVALLTAGPALVGLFLYSRRLHPLIGFSFGDLLRSTARSGGVAATVAIAVLVAGGVLYSYSLPPLVHLLAQALTASVSWLIALVIWRHPLLGELKSLRAHALPGRLKSRRGPPGEPS